jgi:hypothetical protein
MNGAVKVMVWLAGYVSACVLAAALAVHVGTWWGIGFGLVASFGMGMLALYWWPRPAGARPPGFDGGPEGEPVEDAWKDGLSRPGLYGAWNRDDPPPYWRE